jgi:hypothetical protein
MPKLLRLRLCNIGPDLARMEDLTLRMEDVMTGQAAHTAILLRNGGGKTTLISLILWLLCPDRPMPDTNKIDDFVKSNDRSVLVAEWQMDQQPSLWTGKPQRYLTGVFCEWRTSASQEGKKLQRFFFAARVIEDELCLTLEGLPLFVSRQGRPERRNLASFRQEWKELDNAYPQAEVEYTDTLITWREILERIGVDPELFRYQIRMNTREGGAAEPFLFKENERFIDFFLELMGDAATGNDIAATITDWRQALLDLRQKLEPEERLLQTLTQHLAILCEVANERDRLYLQISSIRQEINSASYAVQKWIADWRQEQDTLRQQEKHAHEEHLRLKNEANQRRRRTILLRYWAARKQVQRLRAEAIELDALVQEKKRQHVIWQAAIPLRLLIRARTKAESIEKQLNELLREHEPLLQTVQESARRYAAALSAKAAHLRAEERRLRDLAKEQRTQALQLRERGTEQLVAANGYDARADNMAEKLMSFRALRNQLEERGILQPDESWEQAQKRLLLQQYAWLKEQQTLETTIETLNQDQEDIQGNISKLREQLSRLEAQISLEQATLKPAREARQQIAHDQALRQYLQLTELDFDQLTPQALEILRTERDAAEQSAAQLRLALKEQEAILEYLSLHGFLPPAQAVTQVLELLKKQHVTCWSGWQYLTESVREADRRSWLQRLPELAFGIVLPDEQCEQAQQILRANPPYLETPVVIFARREMQEDVPARGWTIGPTSDAYFNTAAGNRELLDRQERYQHLQQSYDDCTGNLSALKNSIHLLEHTFEHYSTAWWEEHQHLLAETQKQKSDIETQRRQLEQELHYCKTQIAERAQQRQQLLKQLQDLGGVLSQLQAYEPLLTIDVGALQDEEHQQRAQAERCRNEAQKLQAQANNLDEAANETTQAEKQVAEEAKEIEIERSKIEYLPDEAPEASAGDIPLLRDEYQSLLEQYQQKVGDNELTARRANALKEAEHARRQFEKKLQKIVSEQEVRDALDTLADPDEAEQRTIDAHTEQVHAERDKRDKAQELAHAEEAVQDIKKKLLAQEIDENEGSDSIPESEEGCIKAAVEEEQRVSNCDQAAQQQRSAEQNAQHEINECTLRIKSFERVQNQIQTMLHGYASLLATVSTTEAVADLTGLETSTSSEETEITYQPDTIDHALRDIEELLKLMQEEKENLNRRSKQSTHEMSQALNEVSREFKEVTLAKRLLEYGEEGFEQHCRTWFPELSQRHLEIQEQRKQLQVSRDILVQQLLALADAGIAFLNSAARYSKLPATLPAFEQRAFLRIHLSEPVSKEERVGKIADLLDTIVREKTVPDGIALLQQAVRRLASPIDVQILFPDPAHLYYVPPTRMMKESGGERLTSMVLLYCTLLRMRVAHRTKPAGKTSCLILDNPLGVASRAIFLELQREVAEAMNIQLIYTTAIKDFEALHVFPNIIRIRNDQLDRRTGYRLMMHDTSPEGLEAIRIMHSESRDFSREHQEHES